MNPEDREVSQHLKKLDEVQAAQDVPEFDLDAVIIGGERRVRRRTALGAALGTAGAGLVLALALSGALPSSFWSEEPEPAPGPAPTLADLAYTQSGDSVTVYSDEQLLARVTLLSADLNPQGIGEVELTVEAEAPFTLDPADFIWAGKALDREPRRAHRELTVERFQRLSWSYDQVSDGELAWTLPNSEQPVAVWSVSTGSAPSQVRADRVWYLQRQNTVTVFEGTRAQAQVGVSDVAVRGRTGQARVRLTARGQYELRADDFVWSSATGSEHAPTANSWKSLIVTAAWGSSTAPLEFGRVEEGYLLWAPGGKETVGVWASS